MQVTPEAHKDIEGLVVLGPPGSYLDGLATSMDLGYPIEYGDSFSDMIAQAEANPETAVLLPIQNTLNGPLKDVIHAFQAGKLIVTAEVKLDVVSNIMGIGTLEDARSIGGKDVALQQITKFMPHLERVIMPSTSAAGQYIQQTGDRTMLSVGARAQADLYGLSVLAEAAQDTDGINRTTVLMARGNNGWELDPDVIDIASEVNGAMIVRFADSEEAQLLYKILGEIADREINLNCIEPLHVRGAEFSELFITLGGSGMAIADLIKSSQPPILKRLDVLGVYSKPPIYAS